MCALLIAFCLPLCVHNSHSHTEKHIDVRATRCIYVLHDSLGRLFSEQSLRHLNILTSNQFSYRHLLLLLLYCTKESSSFSFNFGLLFPPSSFHIFWIFFFFKLVLYLGSSVVHFICTDIHWIQRNGNKRDGKRKRVTKRTHWMSVCIYCDRTFSFVRCTLFVILCSITHSHTHNHQNVHYIQ